MNNKVAPKNFNVISETYKLLFNKCDIFNSYLHSLYWPYSRWGWQANFDDFFFSAMILNLFILYNEEVIQIEEPIEMRDFCLLAANAIIEHVEGRKFYHLKLFHSKLCLLLLL